MSRRGVVRPPRYDAESIGRSAQSIITELDLLVQTGDKADRPTAAGTLRFYWAEDTEELFLDVKGSWVKVGGNIEKADLKTPLGLTLGEA